MTFTSSFLYNPSNGHQHSHSASLAVVHDHVQCVWYNYPDQEHRDASLAISQWHPDSGWDKARALALPLSVSLGNPCLWWDATEQRLWLWFVALRGNYWDRAEIMACHSDDHGRSWSTPTSLKQPLGYMIRHPPQRIDNTLVLPAYDESANRIHMLTAHHPGGPWREHCAFSSGLIQADMVMGDDGGLLLASRPTEPPREVHMLRSGDHGHSWSAPFGTGLPCPLSGIALIRWHGRLICIHNNTTKHQRWPLTLSWSPDDGRSWSGHIDLDQAQLELSYPSVLIDANDCLHVIYTFNRRMLKHMMLTPQWWDAQT